MHTCPECGQACSCAGDCEDHDTGDEFYVDCEHCMDGDLVEALEALAKHGEK